MIREMCEKDWFEIANIYKQSLERGNATFNTICPTYEEWDKSHLSECRFVYVKNDIVVGFAVLSPTSSREAYRGVVEVSVYVHEKCFRQGIGEGLLLMLMDEARKNGYWTLYAAVFMSNVASIELHKKCGFRVVGERELIAKDCFGNWQSTVILEWRNEIR